MDKSLYNKVFNNVFLKKKIIDYIQYNDWNINYENDNDTTYETILKSKNLYDITLSNLLKNKEFNLFNKLFDILINKYQIDEENNQVEEEDFYEIFKYKELGINRFKIIFEIFNKNNNSDHQEIDKVKLLKSIFSTGNMEILNFIKEYFNDENYFENVSVKNKTNGDLWLRDEYNQFFNNASSESLTLLDCGNNLEFFKEIYFKRMDQKYRSKYLKMIINFTKVGYYNLYSFLIEQYNPSNLFELIQISIRLSSLELANCIIKFSGEREGGGEAINKNLNFLNKKLIEKYLNGFYNGGGLNFTDLKFIIFKSYLPIDIGNLFIKLEELGEFKGVFNSFEKPIQDKVYYYQFKFWEIKDPDEMLSLLNFRDPDIISNLLIDTYLPNSIKEYNEMIKIGDSSNLIESFLSFQSKGNTIVLQLFKNDKFAFEFTKFVIDWLIEKSKVTIEFVLKASVDSNFEICSYYSNKYQDRITPDLFHLSTITFSNGFCNGDLKYYKFVESTFSKYIPNFYDIVLQSSVISNNLELIKYILPNEKLVYLSINNYNNIEISLKRKESLFSCLCWANTYNRFLIFIYLINYYVSILELKQLILDKSETTISFNSKFIHYLLNENLISIENNNLIFDKLILLLYNDFHLFKLFSIKFPNLIKLNLFKILKNSNNFKILNYLINNILNKFGGDNDDDINYLEKEKQDLISNLIGSGSIKKLKLLISNSSNFILKQIYNNIIKTNNINGLFGYSNLNFKIIKFLFETIESKERDDGVLSIKEVYFEFIFILILFKDRQRNLNLSSNQSKKEIEKPYFIIDNFNFLKNYNNIILNNSNDFNNFIKSMPEKTKQKLNENLKLFTNLELELIGINNNNEIIINK